MAKKVSNGVLVETTILVDFLRGASAAADYLDEARSHGPLVCSLVTAAELTVGAQDRSELRKMRQLLARFEVEPWEPDDQRGHSIVIVRRDGEPATGVRAFAMMTRCLPLLFPLWAPVALVVSFTRRGDLTTRG